MFNKALGIPVLLGYNYLLVEFFRELYLSLENLLIDGHRIIVIEGVNAGDHFVCQDSQGPPVDRFSVTLIKQNFRREVLWRTAQCVSPCLAVLCEAKVSEFEVALHIDEDVLRLEISIDDVLGVQVFKHQGHLRRVEPIIIN